MQRLPTDTGLSEEQATPSHESRFGRPLDPVRAWTAVARSRRWLLGAAALGAVVGLAVAFFMVAPTYQSELILRVDDREELPGVAKGEHAALVELEEDFKALPVLQRTHRELDLKGDAKDLRDRIETSTSSETDTVGLEVDAPEPKRAQALATSLAQQVLRYRKEQRATRIEASLEGVKHRIERQREEVERTRDRYRAFLDEHGIRDLSEDGSLQTVATLRAKRNATESDVQALEARVEQLEEEVENTPEMEVASAARISPERDRLAALHAELAQARSSLSDDHPKVAALSLQVSKLRKRVRSGQTSSYSQANMTQNSARRAAQTDLSRTRADLESTRERLKSLESLLEKSESETEEFEQLEGQAIALRTQVKVAQELLASLLSDQARLRDAAMDPHPGASIVKSADLPRLPEPAKTRWMAAAGVPLAAIALVLIVALAIEFRGGRIATPAELGYWGKGPVLAASPWPRDPTALEELVADFDDYLPHVEGETLMIPATDSTAFQTGLLARRLEEAWVQSSLYVEAIVRGDQPPAAEVHPPALASGETHASYHDAIQAAPNHQATRYRNEQAAIDSAAQRRRVRVWNGGMKGHGLRQAARLADRVIVVVEAGSLTPWGLGRVRTALAREQGVGFVLIAAREVIADGSDRVGPVMRFWQHQPSG